jgi:hypothetical protein
VPVATYCCVPLRASATLAGVMVIAVSAPETVTVLAGEVIPPSAAVIEIALVLLVRTVAKPALLIPTAVGLEDFQVTEEVMLAVVPFV